MLLAIVVLYIATQLLRTVGDVFLANWADACAKEDSEKARLALNITLETAAADDGSCRMELQAVKIVRQNATA